MTRPCCYPLCTSTNGLLPFADRFFLIVSCGTARRLRCPNSHGHESSHPTIRVLPDSSAFLYLRSVCPCRPDRDPGSPRGAVLAKLRRPPRQDSWRQFLFDGGLSLS